MQDWKCQVALWDWSLEEARVLMAVDGSGNGESREGGGQKWVMTSSYLLCFLQANPIFYEFFLFLNLRYAFMAGVCLHIRHLNGSIYNEI